MSNVGYFVFLSTPNPIKANYKTLKNIPLQIAGCLKEI